MTEPRSCPFCAARLIGPFNGDAYRCPTHGILTGMALAAQATAKRMNALLEVLRTTGQCRLRYNGRSYPESKLTTIAERAAGELSEAAKIDRMRSELEALEADMRIETEWLDFMQHG